MIRVPVYCISFLFLTLTCAVKNDWVVTFIFQTQIYFGDEHYISILLVPFWNIGMFSWLKA